MRVTKKPSGGVIFFFRCKSCKPAYTTYSEKKKNYTTIRFFCYAHLQRKKKKLHELQHTRIGIPCDGDDRVMKDAKGPKAGSDSMPRSKINPTMIHLIEAMWSLVYTATQKYKEKYESQSSQFEQAVAPEVTDGLSIARARLKKAMSQRFKMVDGIEYFEVHKDECVWSDSQPVGPCQTCRDKGKVERHWVWQCVLLE